jgi:hypothetical protein
VELRGDLLDSLGNYGGQIVSFLLAFEYTKQRHLIHAAFNFPFLPKETAEAEILARNKERSLDYARDDNEKQKRTIQQ